MNDDTNGPNDDAADADEDWPDSRMTVEERQWYEGWRRLVGRYGRHVPQPIELYGDPYSSAGCFVVIDAAVCTIQPVFVADGDPLTFSPALQEELRDDHIFNVRDRWGIPESGRLPVPSTPAAP